MIKYQVTEDTDVLPVSYGVRAYVHGRAVKTIPGVFQSKDDAQQVVALLNELAIELCHFEDVLEDYLTDFSL